jgi:hypothetical protein
LAVVEVADVALDEMKRAHCAGVTKVCTSSRLRRMPVAKLSSPTTRWSSLSKRFQQVAADEAGHAGHQPRAGL